MLALAIVQGLVQIMNDGGIAEEKHILTSLAV